jgi:cytidine deaminase
MILDDATWSLLERAARDAQTRAYAPYSNFHVGAALLGIDGVIYTGCNVENASFGATICAERTAIVKAVDAGCREILACVVIAPLDEAITPCGICRQVLSEFGPSMLVRCLSQTDDVLDTNLAQLLPGAFQPRHLGVAKP